MIDVVLCRQHSETRRIESQLELAAGTAGLLTQSVQDGARGRHGQRGRALPEIWEVIFAELLGDPDPVGGLLLDERCAGLAEGKQTRDRLTLDDCRVDL